MRHIKECFTALITIVSLTSVSECNHTEIAAEAIPLSKCNPEIKLEVLKVVKDEEAVIEQFTREIGTDRQVYYLAKYPSAPTGYLSVCNLPDDYKINNLIIKFSGTIYKIEDIDFQNRNSIPAEFSSIQKPPQK